jgi:hypothetical protein
MAVMGAVVAGNAGQGAPVEAVPPPVGAIVPDGKAHLLWAASHINFARK